MIGQMAATEVTKTSSELESPMTAHRILAVGIVAAALAAGVARAQELTTPQVEAAIKAGLQKKSLAVQGRAGLFSIVVEGPTARVARAANDAASEFKPFIASQVTPEMRAPIVTIMASPDAPTIHLGRISPTPNATHMVLLPRGSKDSSKAVQPIRKNQVAQQFGNAMGASVTSQGLLAEFSLTELPAGEFDVVVIAENGVEHRRTIKKDDRQQIR